MQDLTLTILLVDDHPVVRAGLRTAINGFRRCEVVGEAASGEEALFLCQQLRPDIVLMDLNMEGIGGIEAARAVRQAYPATKVIALTSFADHTAASAMLAAGVQGFLLKDFSLPALEQAIIDVSKGVAVISDEIGRLIAADSGEPEIDKFDLGAQQASVLFFITKGLTNSEISGQMGISVATVRYHVSVILEKLGVSNRTEASAFAIANNLIP